MNYVHVQVCTCTSMYTSVHIRIYLYLLCFINPYVKNVDCSHGIMVGTKLMRKLLVLGSRKSFVYRYVIPKYIFS